MTSAYEPFSCSICGRNMRDKETGATCVGLHLSVDGTSTVYPEMAGQAWNICMACSLKPFLAERRG